VWRSHARGGGYAGYGLLNKTGGFNSLLNPDLTYACMLA